MGSSVITLQKTISAVGTAEQLTATETPCSHVTISAKGSNGVYIYIGDSTVTTSTGVRLGIPTANATAPMIQITDGAGLNTLNLADIYLILDSTPAAAQAVNCVYVVR